MMRARPGFTIAEVMIAAILVGLIALGIARVMGMSTVTAREERHKMQAILIASSELARLRAAGPLALAQADTFMANRYGRPSVEGDYEVAIESTIRCEGGIDPADNAQANDPFGGSCEGVRGVGIVRVRVRYPTDRDPLGGEVSYELAIGASSVHADSLGAR